MEHRLCFQCTTDSVLLLLQADTPWRKVAAKLEGEPAYEELDKVDRVDVYAEYIR